MIDLKPFCGTDEIRPYLSAPFSRGEFTYATDGRICVRVNRREDAPEQENYERPKITQLPWAGRDYTPLPALNLPQKSLSKVHCHCYDGKEHECPDCECICKNCGGTGELTDDSDCRTSVDLLGINFSLFYVRLILSLPNIEIAKVTIGEIENLAFKFDGGEGFLMLLRARHKNHIESTP